MKHYFYASNEFRFIDPRLSPTARKTHVPLHIRNNLYFFDIIIIVVRKHTENLHCTGSIGPDR